MGCYASEEAEKTIPNKVLIENKKVKQCVQDSQNRLSKDPIQNQQTASRPKNQLSTKDKLPENPQESILKTISCTKTSNFPNSLITEKHLKFFYKYGFMVIRGLHTQQQISVAREGAQYLISQERKAVDGGKGEQAFGKLPEGKRSSWGRCEEKRLMKYFDFDANLKMCENIIGKFEFKHHHPGPGYYTFAPRFYSWNQNPKTAQNDKEVKLIEPYDLNDLPQNMSNWSKEFLKNAAELGMKFAPSKDNNWHIDGIDYNKVSTFSILWGSYINSLPKGNMGNLTIRPGTHHIIADLLKKKGQFFHYDGKVEKAKPLPELKREGIADGEFYSVIVEAGDIILAHPWLAHGIGGNFSRDIRLAVYCRLSNPNFYMKCRSEMAGTSLIPTKQGLPDPKRWQGDYWANVPHINEWVKENKEFLSAYDNGELEKELSSL